MGLLERMAGCFILGIRGLEARLSLSTIKKHLLPKELALAFLSNTDIYSNFNFLYNRRLCSMRRQGMTCS